MNKHITDYKSVIKHIYFMIGVITIVFFIILVIHEYHRSSILTKTAVIEADFKNSKALITAMIELIHSSKSKLVDVTSLTSSTLKVSSTNIEIIEQLKLKLNYHINALQNIEDKNYQHHEINPFDTLKEKIPEVINSLSEFQKLKYSKSIDFQTIVSPLMSELEKYYYLHQGFEGKYLNEIEELNINQFILTLLLSLFVISLAIYIILKVLKIIKAVFEDKDEAERKLYFSENNFREITENANEGILVALDGKHVFANKAIYKLLGYEGKELLETSIDDVVHPDDLDQVTKNFKNRISEKFSPRE